MGAVVEAYAIDGTSLDELLDNPISQIEIISAALIEVFNLPDIEEIKHKHFNALSRRLMPDPGEDSLLVITAIVRSIGKYVGGFSINSSVIIDFEKSMANAGLEFLLWSKKIHGRSNLRPTCGFVELSDIPKVKEYFAIHPSNELSEFADIYIEILEEAEWREQSLALLWI